MALSSNDALLRVQARGTFTPFFGRSTMDRRRFVIAGGSLLISGPAWAATNKLAVSPQRDASRLDDRVAEIEAASGGRLGVAMHDIASDHRFAYRGNDRFKLQSTVKLMIAAATLARAAEGKERLDRRIEVGRGSHWGWSPFTERRAGSTATVRELCQAMTVESDNGAAALLLPTLGGAAGLQRFLHAIGDRVTGFEPGTDALLQVESGRTTPLAMCGNAQRLWLGSALPPAHRAQLVAWAVASTTGRTRLRAGLPAGWRAGAKSGTGEHVSNDVAVFWPSGRKPVVVASYLADCNLETDAANAIHAEVARALVRSL
jgi:beta-lactamase class A